MRPFEALTYSGQMRRLRHLVDMVLPHYSICDAKITLLQYEDNAVYRIAARSGEQFVLRINAAGGHTAAEQLSEVQWLTALHHETGLLVPEPVQTVDGEFLITVEAIGVPVPRHCVLFRWIAGEPLVRELRLCYSGEHGHIHGPSAPTCRTFCSLPQDLYAHRWGGNNCLALHQSSV